MTNIKRLKRIARTCNALSILFAGLALGFSLASMPISWLFVGLLWVFALTGLALSLRADKLTRDLARSMAAHPAGKGR